MANEFYTPSGYPSTNSFGASGGMRAELAAVMAGFDKMPIMSTAALKMLRVNAAGTAVEAVDGATIYLTIAAAAAGYLPLHGTADAAATATKLTNARLIGGTSFDGTANIGVALAATATALANARTIGGTSFDGTANIAVALAATATALATPRTIGGTSFDGTANISVGLASNAVQLQTARAINGVNFDGTGNITIAAAAGTLTGATLAAGVTASSLTSVGTLLSLSITGALVTAGNTTLGDAVGDTLNVANGSLQVDASGNVGIGVAPTTKLDVFGNYMVARNGTFSGYFGFGSLITTGAAAELAIRSDGGDILLGTSTTLRMRVGATITDGAGNELGYRGLPSASITTGTPIVSDAGKVIYLTAGVTMPNAIFKAGDIIVLQENTGATKVITQGASVTMIQTGTGATGNRTLKISGRASILWATASLCYISGDVT